MLANTDTFWAILGLLCSILAAHAIITKLYTAYFFLADVPGPRTATWTRLWLLQAYSQPNQPEPFLRAQERYGALVRIGPKQVLTSDLATILKMLGTQSLYLRSDWFNAVKLHPHVVTVGAERDPKKHDARRRLLAAGYADRGLSAENRAEIGLLRWLNKVQQQVHGSPGTRLRCDLGRRIRFLTLEMFSHIISSEDPAGFGKEHAIDEFWNGIETNGVFGQYISVLPELFNLIWTLCKVPGWDSKILPTPENDKSFGRVLEAARTATRQRYDPTSNVPGSQDDLLKAWKAAGLPYREALGEVQLALIAGAFPTAAATNVSILCIATNAHVQSTLRSEIDQALSQPDAVDRPVIKHAQAQKLPYLQACLAEALRWQAPITQLLERTVPPGGDVVCGHHIPGGVKIGYNIRALQLHSCFGPDPDRYWPERWIHAEQDAKQDLPGARDRLKEMRKVSGLVFGHGSAKCMGMDLATMCLEKLVFEVFARFDVGLVNPVRPWVDYNSGVSFHSHFDVVLSDRRHTDNVVKC